MQKLFLGGHFAPLNQPTTVTVTAFGDAGICTRPIDKIKTKRKPAATMDGFLISLRFLMRFFHKNTLTQQASPFIKLFEFIFYVSSLSLCLFIYSVTRTALTHATGRRAGTNTSLYDE